MARRARGRHTRRDGAHQPGPHPACAGAGRTLRDPAAADGQSRGQAGGESESPPGKDGICMELKPSYKQTEVGMIPEDWEVVSIGSLASFTSGTGISIAALRQQSPDTPVPVYGGNGIAGYTT